MSEISWGLGGESPYPHSGKHSGGDDKSDVSWKWIKKDEKRLERVWGKMKNMCKEHKWRENICIYSVGGKLSGDDSHFRDDGEKGTEARS